MKEDWSKAKDYIRSLLRFVPNLLRLCGSARKGPNFFLFLTG
jgi:hypothetical protein